MPIALPLRECEPDSSHSRCPEEASERSEHFTSGNDDPTHAPFMSDSRHR